MSASSFLRGLLGLLLLGSLASAAGPKAITKVPFEIKTPGRYLLTRSVTFTSPTALAAILISADDVVLDLGESIITCDPTLGTTTDVAGVRADGRKNLTIRGGTVRGFARGIYLEGTATAAGSHLVEGIHADRCTFLGIQVKGRGSIIRRNRVTAVGGSTFFTINRFGLHLTGFAIKALENEIDDVIPTNANVKTYGIFLTLSSLATVQKNRLTASALTFLPNHINTAIYLDNSGSCLLEGNFLANWNDGINFANGSSTSVYRDNTLRDISDPYTGELSNTDGGGNN